MPKIRTYIFVKNLILLSSVKGVHKKERYVSKNSHFLFQFSMNLNYHKIAGSSIGLTNVVCFPQEQETGKENGANSFALVKKVLK